MANGPLNYTVPITDLQRLTALKPEELSASGRFLCVATMAETVKMRYTDRRSGGIHERIGNRRRRVYRQPRR
mgnify:CR=1 FL=1